MWFGEPLDSGGLDVAIAAMAAADVTLIVGTSAIVYPVAALPQIARRSGARLVEINPDPTPLSACVDAVVRGPAGQLLPALEQRL